MNRVGDVASIVENGRKELDNIQVLLQANPLDYVFINVEREALRKKWSILVPRRHRISRNLVSKILHLVLVMGLSSSSGRYKSCRQ